MIPPKLIPIFHQPFVAMSPAVLITKVEIYKSRIALKEPFKISLGILTHAENVIVKLTTDAGITGFGECSPFLTINGESMDTCFIVAQYLGKTLINKNALDIAGCTVDMEKVIYANNSIKSAFDMALYDIAAHHAGQPLYKFLGGTNTKALITDYTVSIDDPAKMASDAARIKANGFQVIKVKLGQRIDLDLERMKRIREAVGMEIPIRIDANQGWEPQSALTLLNNLAPLNIQHCEEPIPRWNFMALPELKKKSPIRLMADESCCDQHDARRLIDLDACDLFNVKLGKSGGIFNAMQIAEIAENHNISIQVGGFLESRLAFTAAAHFALASDNIIYCDFDTPLMFVDDPVSGGIEYDRQGVISVPEIAGLGARFSEDYLQDLESVSVY
ncbi:MAG: dipeptide epimerase [Bacteroidota bacterium]